MQELETCLDLITLDTMYETLMDLAVKHGPSHVLSVLKKNIREEIEDIENYLSDFVEYAMDARLELRRNGKDEITLYHCILKTFDRYYCLMNMNKTCKQMVRFTERIIAVLNRMYSKYLDDRERIDAITALQKMIDTLDFGAFVSSFYEGIPFDSEY